MMSNMEQEQSTLTHQPSLQEIQAPTVSYKDRKMLMLLYEGKLKKPEKLRSLMRKGYVRVDESGEFEPTVVGSLLIDFTVKARNAERDRRQAKAATRKPNRKTANSFGFKRGQPDFRNVSDRKLDLGDSDRVEHDPHEGVGEADGHPSDLQLANVRAIRATITD